MIDLFRQYAMVCALLGAVQIVDGLVLWQRRGVTNRWLLAFGAFETLWMFVSVYIAWKAWFVQPVAATLALVFCIYNAAAMFDGVRDGLRQSDPDGLPRLPPRTVARGIAFGAAFCLFSLFVIVRLGGADPV